jgi:hypothetical protein
LVIRRREAGNVTSTGFTRTEYGSIHANSSTVLGENSIASYSVDIIVVPAAESLRCSATRLPNSGRLGAGATRANRMQLTFILNGWVGISHFVLGIGTVSTVIDANDSAVIGCERAGVAVKRTTVGRGRRGSGAGSGGVGASSTGTTNRGSHN